MAHHHPTQAQQSSSIVTFTHTSSNLILHESNGTHAKQVVGGDDFITDLGISYVDFELPDEIDEYYDAKEAAGDDM